LVAGRLVTDRPPLEVISDGFSRFIPPTSSSS
jgi:hypothetical protein